MKLRKQKVVILTLGVMLSRTSQQGCLGALRAALQANAQNIWQDSKV